MALAPQPTITTASTMGGTSSDVWVALEPETPLPPFRRPINIQPLNYGYEVTVGCQKLAIEKPETLLKHLGAYLKDPAKVEKLWLSGKYKI
ncbi:MAG: hypothetical protein PHV11_08700 [Candidatus Bipolaricaulis sp.]|nr:hypothetical protein [Candidatus Bipolaricaulis sp.]